MSQAQRASLPIPPSTFLDEQDCNACEASIPMPAILPLRAVVRQV